MEAALEWAGLDVTEIDYTNVHTSIASWDVIEAISRRLPLGEQIRRLYVTNGEPN